MTLPMPLRVAWTAFKAAVMTLVAYIVGLYALFAAPGPLKSAAWQALVPLNALVIGYYVHKKYFARRSR